MFLSLFGLGVSQAYATISDDPNDNRTVEDPNDETDKLKSKSSKDKYSFTLFNFFNAPVQSKTDTTNTGLKELKEGANNSAIKTTL